MKKILKLIILTLVLTLGIGNVYALDVKQDSLSVSDKSSTIKINDEGIGNLSIKPDIEFNEVGDFITYKLVLKNTDGKKYKVLSVSDDNTNEYIKTSYKSDNSLNTDNKEIFITLKYEKEFKGSNPNLKSIKVTIKLVDEDNNTQDITLNNDPNVPKTGDSIGGYIWLLSLSLSGIILGVIYIKKYNKKLVKGLFIVVLTLTLIPSIVLANGKDIIFNLNLENVKINAYYTVTFDSDGGSEIKPLKVKHNDTINKPDDPVKEGYRLDKWLDEEGNDYTFGTAVTRDINLKAKWELLTGTLMVHDDDVNNTFGKAINRHSFEKIISVDHINVPASAIDSWDVSEEQNGSVKAWYLDEDSNGEYELYLGQIGGVVANQNSENTFSEFERASLIKLDKFDTSQATNMRYMFGSTGYNANTFELDVSNWNTSKVINMQSMFQFTGGRSSTFKIIGLDDWNTSQVQFMSMMFAMAGQNSTTWSIGNLSNWDTLKVRDMIGMFSHAGNKATTWESIGTLNIYANYISSMFGNCPSANVTLTMMGNPTSYEKAFEEAATKPGAKITVNYRSITTNIDNIIATKSSNSNVVKGDPLD